MPNEQLYRELQNLERKIQLVLNENKRLKEDLYRIKDERNELKAKLERQQTNIDNFQNQIKISKIANSMIVSEEESAMLKHEIEGYIREIDNCIAHLAEK
ncbi:MAG: hypothetical protein AAGA66_06055 [Bacteroidota bacterium]